MSKTKVALFGLLITAVVQNGHAAIINLTGSVDLSGGYTGDLFGTLDQGVVSIAVGDTVNLTYNFTGGELRLADTPNGFASSVSVSGWLGLATGGSSGSFTVSNWTINLLGATSGSGTAPTSISALTHTSGSIHLGPFGTIGLADGDYLQFSGISTSFLVSALPANPNLYGSVRTRFNANQRSVEPAAAAVPEPGGLGLLGLGLLGLAFARRNAA